MNSRKLIQVKPDKTKDVMDYGTICREAIFRQPLSTFRALPHEKMRIRREPLSWTQHIQQKHLTRNKSRPFFRKSSEQKEAFKTAIDARSIFA
jgi:hypothetical protein